MTENYSIEECVFPKMTVLSERTRDSLRAMGKYIKELYAQAARRGLRPSGPIFAIYFEKPTDPKNVDYEMVLPVEGPSAALDELADMGGDPCLYLRVIGSYSQFGAAYKALEEYVTAKGIEMSGPPREVYVRGPLLGFLTFIPTMVTDIYFPIKK